MAKYFLRRLLQLIPTVFGIYTITFFLTHVLPGDPASFLLGTRESAETLENLRHVMKLDQPLPIQYLTFLQSALQGDLGTSYLTHQPVTEMIAQAFWPTVTLALIAMFLAVGIGVPLGVLAAARKNSIADNLSRLLALVLVSVPVFWLGIEMQIVFGLQLKWFPISGIGADAHIVMPALALCGGPLALLTRMTRSNLAEELNQDYVRTAQSKGLRARVVLWRHAFRNALIPIVTVWGGSLAGLLSGALLVEVIFNWPGLGYLLQRSIQTRDYSVLQGLIITLALIYAGMNLLIDLTYPLIDPRIRY
jgi:peptide/nickel transport system permease protein